MEGQISDAPGSERSSVEWLHRWLPMNLTSHGISIPLEGILAPVVRDQGEPGRSCYLKARGSLEAVIASLPPGERYPALSVTWEEATGL